MEYKCVTFHDIWKKFDGATEQQLQDFLNKNMIPQESIVSISHSTYVIGYHVTTQILLVYVEG